MGKVALTQDEECWLKDDTVKYVMFTINIIINGGGAGTTDWENPTSGLAYYWGPIQYP